jgi:regulator of protease activity HflC (stomatin/prohibitin superfamily)
MNYPSKNWKTVTIASIIREETRHTISNFTAIEVIEKRAAIEESLNQAIRQGLLGESSLAGAIVESTLEVDLRDIDPSLEFIRAIEAKLAAEQAKIQAQFEYERALILARAESESMIIVANGTREAIDTIVSITGETNSTRIAELYLTVEALKTIAPNAKNFIVVWGSGQTPIVYPIQDGA